MRRQAGDAALVELKAVDPATYPAAGDLATDPPGRLADLLAERDGVPGALADPALPSETSTPALASLTTCAIPISARFWSPVPVIEVELEQPAMPAAARPTPSARRNERVERRINRT